jgi:hypothetical protein
MNARFVCSSGAKVVLKQIEENRQEKLLKDEMREQENLAMLEFLEDLQKQDYEELKKRKDQQKKLAVSLILISRLKRTFILLKINIEIKLVVEN